MTTDLPEQTNPPVPTILAPKRQADHCGGADSIDPADSLSYTCVVWLIAPGNLHMTTFRFPPGMRAEIIAHARAGYPEEVCGIIAGTAEEGATLYRGRNISPTPAMAYELDAETLARQIEFEDAGLVLAAIYHSHPRGPETPSPTDVERAFYPDSVYLICSLADPERPLVRGFRISDGQVSEVELVG